MIQNCLHAFQCYVTVSESFQPFSLSLLSPSFTDPAHPCSLPAQVCARAELSQGALAP